MPARNVVLREHQHGLVETVVQSGGYQNASAVLREGLRLIVAALRDVARQPGRPGSIERPKLGPVFGRGTCD